MVDLGFLLISFFIFTTTMAESKGTDLLMPKEGPPINLKESTALTLLLHADDEVYVYEGAWKEAAAGDNIHAVNFKNNAALRKLIVQKQQALGQQKEQLMVLIKPGENSRYSNVVDALDEMLLNNVKRYAVVDVAAEEKTYLDNLKK